MGMFGSLFGAPKKKKYPGEYDPILTAQEQAWGFPAKEEPEVVKPKSDRWIDGGKFTAKDALGIALTSVGDAFTRQAGGQGDTLAAYMGQAHKARAEARKAKLAAEQAAQNAAMIRAARPDLNDTQARAIAANVLNPSDFKQPDVPSFVKNLDAWNQMTDQQKQQVAAMQAVLNATFGQGADGIRRPDAPVMGTPVGTVEDGYEFTGGDDTDPKNWRKVGGAGSATPRPFR